MSIFNQMIARYEIRTQEEQRNAAHEVMQQIALAGLYRGGFFNKAAFYGGTCLRMFHKLQRFSEDMDFSLLRIDPDFRLENYFDVIINEFIACGQEVVITKKDKNNFSTIESAFLKENTLAYDLSLNAEKHIKIKLEVDINPPLGFQTESKLLLMPFSFMTSCFVLPDLFAGKMHALMFRKWKNRVKGRDWYDFEWFVRNNVPIDLNHFKIRSLQSKDIVTLDFSIDDFNELLKNKINEVDFNQVKSDVLPFMKNKSETSIWSKEYFLQLVRMIRIVME